METRSQYLLAFYIALFKFCVLLFFLSLNPQYLVFEPAYCGFKDMKGPHCIAEVGGRQKPRRQMNVAVVHLLARDISQAIEDRFSPGKASLAHI